MENHIIIDFTLFYNKYKARLYNYVFKIVRSRMLAEDIVHDVFIKLYDNYSNIRNLGRIELWLFKTARNEIYSYFRKKINKYNQDNDCWEQNASDENISELIENKELISILEHELKLMDREQSEAYYLKEYSDLSYKEIADIMDITENLVKSRIYKVRQKLKRTLESL